MEAVRQIRAIGIDRLLANPASPNRMPRAAFAKLKSHIERTGNYEPIVVRRHSGRPRCFEIINGAHRAEVLGQLGYTSQPTVLSGRSMTTRCLCCPARSIAWEDATTSAPSPR